MESNIEVGDADGARWITIDRAHKANALRPADCTAIRQAVESLPPAAKAIVIRGAGQRAFCAGMDVTAFLALDASSARPFVAAQKDMLNAVRTAPIPTVAAINGACIGGGLELAMACDLRLASSTAVFGMPEIKIGIPSALDAALLEKCVGLTMAREMMLLGDLYPAERMLEEGLLNRVVAAEYLDASVTEIVGKLRLFTRTVTAAQKRMFETWQNHGITTANEISVDVWAAVFTEPETMAAIAEYKEQHLSRKRPSGS